jgi:hypothetical protein
MRFSTPSRASERDAGLRKNALLRTRQASTTGRLLLSKESHQAKQAPPQRKMKRTRDKKAVLGSDLRFGIDGARQLQHPLNTL